MQIFRRLFAQSERHWEHWPLLIEEPIEAAPFPEWVGTPGTCGVGAPASAPTGSEAVDAVPPTAVPTRGALERFDGRVERVSGDAAFIVLMSSKGERLSGTYPASELAAHGVHEGDRFTLATVAEGDAVRFDIQLIPHRAVTPDRLAAMQEEIRRDLGGYTSDDDY